MYTSEGLVSFYSGLTPVLLGLTHVAVELPTYEYLKTRFTGHGMGEGSGEAHWFGILSASMLSRILASSATLGKGGIVDNRKYRGSVMTFRTILQEEGWRPLYAGLGSNMMRAVPAATVTMLAYEYIMRFLYCAKQEGQPKSTDTKVNHE
ncbi:uncharacterized protein TRIVIDRAFT_195125 [Trichoderma virens Gv29-8]|uniref:Mitochondrial carrier protein n=1 Tax=Hypocrea virens (strain Gv29-8 / FGSC 10586) TaxID=413071 RepID=G9N814_HYPVG|nr:uncharacterized protein TRIVIDRAFT_195125 [Trichoderma virens Gv29-8]EHK17126.1 hypothetical protein TRIVIDRAFT_195125 [Trichoderma virens Gv29-8]UKZ55542.1 hypothetical protein TrVGV298_009366 [Trichoderma virens]